MKRQRLTCVKAVAEICGAKVSEADVGSMELEFEPGPIKGGDYRFDVGTAGSVTLVAQTVVPVLHYTTNEAVIAKFGSHE